MKKKIVWLVVSCLMVLSLVLASCAPAVTEEEEVAPSPAEEEVAPPVEEEVAPEVEMVRNAVGKLVEKPRYGGVFKQWRLASPQYFDSAFGLCYLADTLFQTNEQLLQGDWAKGPQGTGQASWFYFMVPAPDTYAGSLAETWEIVQPDTLIFHIRKGVHFHDKPPTNGREMTADDVVYTLKRLWDSPKSYQYQVFAWDTYLESITAPDKWTVVIKTKEGKLGTIFECAATYGKIVPHEVIDEYGDINDWRNSCGTGPFMLVDYIADSSITFVKNPNYWMKDPLHPENQLPYIDGLKYLIIPDLSTQLAALRTGKVDLHLGVVWEDAEQLMKTNPELKWAEYMPVSGPTIYGKLDTAPFDDKRVRHALALAIDNEAIANTYYDGHAEVFYFPIMPIPEFTDVFIPLDELPESTREMFEYHPDKARQLLAEAGYPDGFKTEVVCFQPYVDLLSIVKEYWAEIGVDMEIDVREYGAYIGLGYGKKYNMYIWGVNSSIPYRFTYALEGNFQNFSLIDDERINEVADAVKVDYFDRPKKAEMLKELVPYILDQNYLLLLPGPYAYSFWQPWVKGFQGELHVGYMGNYFDPHKYVWLDLDLKEEMTGMR